MQRNIAHRLLKGYDLTNVVENLSIDNNEVDKWAENIRLYSRVNQRNYHIISAKNMITSMKTYKEAMESNLALNNKICVDMDGKVKNYIDHDHWCFNILDTNIMKVKNNKSLLQSWNTSKDKIENCKDCKYRYICIDFDEIVKKNGRFYRKHECGFKNM